MQSIRPLFIAFFGLALVVAGCDSQGGTATPDPNGPEPSGGQIELVQPLPDTTIFISQTIEFVLSEYFHHSRKEPINYLTDISSPVVQVLIDRSQPTVGPILRLTLNVGAEPAGSATLTVTATAVGHQVSDTLNVTAVNACRSFSDPNLIDYFPLNPSQEWVFDYTGGGTGDVNDGAPLQTETRGTYSISFGGSPTCSESGQEFQLEHVFDGETRQLQLTPTGKEWTVWRSLTWTSDSVLSESEAGITSFFGNSVSTIPRYADPSSPSTLTFQEIYQDGHCAYTLSLFSDLGPVFYHQGCVYTRSSSFFEIERQ